MKLATRNTVAMKKLEKPLSLGEILGASKVDFVGYFIDSVSEPWSCNRKFVYLRVTTMMPTTDGKIPPIAWPAITAPMYFGGKGPAIPNILPYMKENA